MDKNNTDRAQTLDSREVAEMAEKTHGNLCREIRQHIQYMEDNNGINFDFVIKPSDFFIESSYVDTKGEKRLCYLVTKKGCELIAHKMTGKK